MTEEQVEIINYSNIVEANGKTIRENNLTRQHKFRLGDVVETLVEIDHDLDRIAHVSLRGLCKLYVVSCHRDCDGSPLYTLTDIPVIMPPMVRCDELMKFLLFSKLQLPNVGEEGLRWTGCHMRIFERVQEWVK